MKRIYCRSCDDVVTPEEGECPECGHRFSFQRSSVTDMWSRGGITLEHLGDQPVHFDSKRELRRTCNRLGVQSGALL